MTNGGKELAKRDTLGEELVREGRQLKKTEFAVEQFYQTAISVQKPRDLKQVEMACRREAELAGELFYYQWDVTGSDGKKHKIDGVTIHGAMAIARNFGNCAVPVSAEVDPIDGSVMFKAAFVDLETGFTVPRNFRAHFVQPPGRFKNDPGQKARWFDMQFQKAQSQAQRNVILRGVPFWLTDIVKHTAKTSAFDKIKEMGIDKARAVVIKKFKEEYGVDQAALEKHLDKTADQWTIQDVVTLKSISRALEEGFDTPESVFNAAGDAEAPPIDIDALLETFWKAVARKGVAHGDEEMASYVKSVAAFARGGLASYLTDLVLAFNDPAELDRFIQTFKEKKERGEIKPAEGQGNLF